MKKNFAHRVISLLIILIVPIYFSLASSDKCGGRETFFMQLEYPEMAKPKPRFSLFETQAFSDRCFQFNASAGFILLNPFISDRRKFIHFTGDCTNMIDLEASSCFYGEQEKNLTVQFSPPTVEPGFQVTIRVEAGFVTDIGNVFKSVAKEVSIDVENFDDGFHETFYKDLGNLSTPLGFATKCSLLADLLPNKNPESQWKNVLINFTDIL